SWPLRRASAAISTGVVEPEARLDQFVPSHAARPFAGTSPAWTKLPATNSSLLFLRKARTAGGGASALRPVTPSPTGNHSVPFQRARFVAAALPAFAKSPPSSKSAETGGGRNRTTVEALPLRPPVNGVHAAPFQRATFVALAPLAALNRPPA